MTKKVIHPTNNIKKKYVMLRHGDKPKRNDSLFDLWSLTHIAWAMVLAWILGPVVALVLMVLWEPIEIFVISPLIARYGIKFGYETVRNSLADIFFDILGVALGAGILDRLVDPPFHIF